MTQQIIQGLVNGSVYGLMAIGLVLILNTTGVANFGHVDMGLLPAFVALSLFTAGTPLLVAVALAMVVGALVGVSTYQGIFRPMRQAPPFAIFLATFVVGGLINVVVQLLWGAEVRAFPRLVDGYVSWLPGVSWTAVVVCLSGIVALFLVNLMLTQSRIGLALRAQSQDVLAAKLIGMSDRSAGLLVWGLGVALAALAVVLAGPTSFLGLTTFAPIMLKAFCGAVIGGVHNLWAAYAGCLALGVSEMFIGDVLPGGLLQLRDALTLVILVLVLWLRPQGLFVRASAVRVG